MKTLLVLAALIGCLPATIWMDYAGSAFDSPLLLQNGAASGGGLGLNFLNRFRNRYQTYDNEAAEETYNKAYNSEDDYKNDDYQRQDSKTDKDYQQTKYQKSEYKMDDSKDYDKTPSVEYKRPKSAYTRQRVYKKHKKYQPAYIYSRYVRPDYSKDNSYKKYSNARPVYKTKGDYRENKISDKYRGQESQAYDEQSHESSSDKGIYSGYKSAQKPDSNVRYNSRYEKDRVNDQQRYTTKYDDSYWSIYETMIHLTFFLLNKISQQVLVSFLKEIDFHGENLPNRFLICFIYEVRVFADLRTNK